MTLFNLPLMIQAWLRPLPPVLVPPRPMTPWFRPGAFFIALRMGEISK